MLVSELFIYDPDDSLFKSIITHSKVMQGRYFVVSSGFDINNLDPVQKYPCMICVPPRSNPVAPSYIQETFSFDLYFLTRRGTTGQNQIKNPNPATLTSQHPAWYDWKDMNECATAFLRTLKALLKLKMVGDIPLRGIAGLDPGFSPGILRITSSGSDVVSGVKMSLSMTLNLGCDNDDYAGVDLSAIAVPNLNKHPLHKH
jgi:hypothetical protein